MEFNPDPKFPWPIEQVELLASTFFDKAPAKISERDKWTWAARKAVDYLNARRNACQTALDRDKAISNHYDKVRALAKEREKLPAEWPYEKAVKHITGEDVWDRALEKFKLFALHLSNGDAERAENDLESLRGQTITRLDVIALRHHFLGFWEYHLEAQRRESGKKGGRPKKR
jgi:hypothetical protein